MFFDILDLYLKRQVIDMAHSHVLGISDEDYEYLQPLTCRRTIQAQVVDRAKILIYDKRVSKKSTLRASF